MSVLRDLVGDGWAEALAVAILLAGVAVIYLLMRMLVPLASRAARRSARDWDDIICHPKVKHRISMLGPAAALYAGARFLADTSAAWTEPLQRITASVAIVIAFATLSAALHAANEIYERHEVSKDRPIEAYVQMVQILAYLFAAIFAVAVLADQSPWFFAGSLGAIAAVLMVVFRDTLLSVVASIQLVQADLVDIGDWIEMPEFDADGFVIDIALHTVTVQNFDRTVTTIPTHRIVHGSVRNWRGMARSSRRRIKRAIDIDLTTIRFLTDEEIEELSRFEPLAEYMSGKLSELSRQTHPMDDPDADPRRLTNIGTFRAYVAAYLDALDTVDTDGVIHTVRQLDPGPKGLPIEIYAFATTADWAAYEEIQADIFDHVLAMVPRFGLRIFQDPTGEDVRAQGSTDRATDVPELELRVPG